MSFGGFRLIYINLFLVRCICLDVKYSLAVDLESDGAVECDRDLVACLDLNILGVVYVLALEDGREDHECFDLAAAVEEEQ